MNKIKKIGILCEDKSDYDSLRVLIKRIIDIENIPIDGYYPGGCAILKRKAKIYSTLLKQKGCDMLIVVHDRDRNKIDELKLELAMIGCGEFFNHHIICIPVEEIESWFLSDSESLKIALNLKKGPKVPVSPENVNSPKEYLEKLIYTTSNKSKRYLHTRDNLKIATRLSLASAEKKCPSFKELSIFLKTKIYLKR